MTRRAAPALALAVALLAAPSVRADDSDALDDAEGIAFTAALVAPPDGVTVQELVRVVVRAVFTRPENLVRVTEPDFGDARWQRLGLDQWDHVHLRGPDGVAMQRTIAVFPQHSGDLTVGPFTLDATITEQDGTTRHVVRTTPPLALPVRAAAGSGWWLPATALRVTDSWQPDPDALPPGVSAHRTLTIEADGSSAAQLPPLPPMRAEGVITFARPVQLATVPGPDGPMARAIYEWDVRPISPDPAEMPALHFPWFSTRDRSAHEVVVPARRIAWAPDPMPEAPPPPRGAWAWPAVLTVVLLACAGVLVAAWRRRAGAWAMLRDGWRLRLAAARGDARAVRVLLARLLADRPEALRAERAALDRHLYGADASPRPDLKRLARDAVRLRRNVAQARRFPARDLAPFES